MDSKLLASCILHLDLCQRQGASDISLSRGGENLAFDREPVFAKALDMKGNANLLSPALKGRKDNFSHPESSHDASSSTHIFLQHNQ